MTSLVARRASCVVLAFSISTLAGATGAHAVLLTPGGNVTPDVIFGGGNANGSYTGVRQDGLELGLRGKLRFNDLNQAENTFNFAGDNDYVFPNEVAPGGFGFDPNSPTTPVWSFEWSINTSFDGSSQLMLDDFTYQIQLDFDPSAATNFLSFDPISPASSPAGYWDHSIGTNATGNGAGVEATDAASYLALIAANNVAQNSWNYEFFNDGVWDIFNPQAVGTYTIVLSAFDLSGALVASTNIDIVTTPIPAALPLLLTAVGGMGLFGWRKKRAAAQA
jgi:hypothetical protein